jgi:hypothetical protein
MHKFLSGYKSMDIDIEDGLSEDIEASSSREMV